MNDLFDTNQPDQPQIPDNPLEALVGDNKKFKTVEDLARAKWESDQYIKTLEQGRDQLREDYLKALEAAQTGPQVKELLDQLKNQTQPVIHQNADNVTAPTLDPTKVKEMATQTYRELGG
jgi:beta-phosphoglucomutase-like phosphatase (HAD superfamily)